MQFGRKATPTLAMIIMNKCQGCISENKDNCPVFKMPDIKDIDEWFEILKGEPCPIKILTKEAELKN